MIAIAEIALVALLLLAGLPIGFLMFAAWGAVVFSEPLSTPIEADKQRAIAELEQRLGEEIETVSDGGDR